jgi:FkbM family methyltransferase
MDWSLRNLAQLGFQPGVIFDVGAYEGEWTESARKAFPEAAIVMVEAQPGKQARLKQIMEQSGGRIACEITLLGPEEKDAVDFYEMELGSSLLYEQCQAARTKVTRRMTTLDALAPRHGGKVDFLKLDVQGYELEVLKGGEAMLKQVEVVLMEVSLLRVIQGAPLLDEVVAYMKSRGLIAYDICTFMRRPLDRALWQVDMMFVRENSWLVKNTSKGD